VRSSRHEPRSSSCCRWLTLAILMPGFFGWSLTCRAAIRRRSARRWSAGRRPGSTCRRCGPASRLLTDASLRTGKPVIVNFFASWCTPCLAEHPLFTRLAEREGATIVGIAWKNKRDDALGWLKKLGDPFRLAGLDLEGKTGLDWGLSGVPETYLIDGDGIVRRHYRGPITERDLNETILPFLKGAVK
jgi:cytochrome c biogenesis protein CcmG/thiol:disulfide interchange protein DsbE